MLVFPKVPLMIQLIPMNRILLNLLLNQILLKLVFVLQKSMLCKLIFNNKKIHTIFNRFAKARVHNPWVDAVRDELCRILNDRHQLVTIFNFDNDRHHGKLEEAILEAVFNGLSSEIIDMIIISEFYFSCKSLP